MIGKTTGRKDKLGKVRAAHRSNNNSKEPRDPPLPKERPQKSEFSIQKVIGRGTFGMVYLATLIHSGQPVAVKKVLQDDNYKNREHEIIKQLSCPNIVKLHYSYFQREEDPEGPGALQLYLYLVMQYVPEDLHRITRYFHQDGEFPHILLKIYSFQILKALLYLETKSVCHRDVKPRNILVDLASHKLKICDFGSAKKIVKGQPNLAYVCSRYYRAPELEMGNQYYSLKSDMWSAGAVIAEMFLGFPLFASESSVDHMAVIFSKLGTPSKEQFYALNSQGEDCFAMLPTLKRRPWQSILPRCDFLLRDLVSKMLVYDPNERVSPVEAMLHPYFKELKSCKVNGKDVKFLFEFSETELATWKQLRLLSIQ